MQELELIIGEKEKLSENKEDMVEHLPHNISSATEYIYSEELKEIREEAWSQNDK